jgi:hypothetical protein
MHNEIYADAIGEITVTGPIVRIDLVSLSATRRDAADQPVPEFRQRVVMSIEGFANSYEVLQKAMNGLLDAGAIRRNEPEPARKKAPAGLNGNGSSASPNFE